MKISFYGAAGMVTGSCFLLETDNIKILVDCGMFQGDEDSDILNRADFPFDPSTIDFLFLTHSHIDHSGRIPLITKRGFKGKIITTMASMDLCGIMLTDSGYIQEMETEWINRKNLRAGKPLIEPLYTITDAKNSLEYFQTIPLNEIVSFSDDLEVRFINAGHVLGASIIEIWIKENGHKEKIVFTGDLGNKDMPILKDPENVFDADYLVIESTYGNRTHSEIKNTTLLLLDVITDTIEREGNIVIPSFAVGRTQELLYMLNLLKENKFSKIKKIPVFIDSPLAINATRIFSRHSDLFDSETKELLKAGDDPFDFPNLVFTETSEESKAINFHEGSCIIVSASGMCDAGRIKHHLKHNLWKGNSSVVFVGYQAKGSLGRRILDGDKKVKLFGEDIYVNCNIYKLDGLSGHADRNGILEWISSFTRKPKRIFLVHGEEDALRELKCSIKGELNLNAHVAQLGETIDFSKETEYFKDSGVIVDSRKSLLHLIKELKDIRSALKGILTGGDANRELLDKLELKEIESGVNKIKQEISNLNNKQH